MAEHRRFARLIAPHADGLWRFARRLAHSDAEADDLLQDALLTSLARIAELRDAGAARAWAARIVLRTWQTSQRHPPMAPIPAEPVSPGPGPEAQAGHRQAGHRILAAFDTLPVEQSTAVWLVDAEGYTFEETSISLGIAVGTVCSRVARGRVALRRALADLAPESR
jgi:RNA polymerase sigma-70 factor (ECF subfamily)